jgi:glycosyltransferase involved in cell wall biosynthesis
MHNNEMPLVSVVIPTHNRPDFLTKTLQSILDQSYQNMEILVVSNGVNNKNKAAVENFHDSRVQYFEQGNSGGPASPRNHGIRESSGKYLAFCDDDDLWMPDKLAKQIESLEKNPGHGIAYTKMRRFDERSEWSVSHEAGEATVDSLLYTNTIPISSVVILKSLVDLYGGFSESKMVGASEDYEFLVRHALRTKCLFIDEYLIRYWSGNNRTTTVDNARRIKNCLSYLRGVLGCYCLLLKHTPIGFLTLLRPAVFHVKECLKSIAHILVKDIKNVRKTTSH